MFLRKTGLLKFIFALVTVAAFAAVTGHEAIHADHLTHCKVCHVKQVSPADVATAGTALALILVFVFILILFRQDPAGSVRPTRSGRAPPALLA